MLQRSRLTQKSGNYCSGLASTEEQIRICIEILESQNIGGFSFIVTPGMTYEECVERIPNFLQLFPYFQIW